MSRIATTFIIMLLALVHGHAHARCAPVDLRDPIFETASPGGALFFHRVNDHAPQRVGGPPPSAPSVVLRQSGCRERCTLTLQLTPLATNVYVARLPRNTALGRWTFRTRGEAGSVLVERARTTPPMTAPVISQLASQRARGGVSHWIELAADPPPGAVGVLVTWPGSSYFSDIDERSVYFEPGRCGDRPPDYTAPQAGVQLQVAFVDARGRTSPTAVVAYPSR